VLPTSVESCILIKAIKLTSRGVSPYFLARKHTRHRRGHADSRVFANGKAPTYFPYAQSHGPIFVKQTARRARYAGFWLMATTLGVAAESVFARAPSMPVRRNDVHPDGRGEAAPWHPHRWSQLFMGWVVQLHNRDRATGLNTTASF
jgi:hypothetical protein